MTTSPAVRALDAEATWHELGADDIRARIGFHDGEIKRHTREVLRLYAELDRIEAERRDAAMVAAEIRRVERGRRVA